MLSKLMTFLYIRTYDTHVTVVSMMLLFKRKEIECKGNGYLP